MKKVSSKYIRFSCGALVRFSFNKKFVFFLNPTSTKSGKPIYSPLGGALEYEEKGKLELEKLGAINFEGKDLRFFVPVKNVKAIKDWFFKQKNREVGPEREMHEELTKENKLLNKKDLKSSSLSFLGFAVSPGVSNRFSTPVKTIGLIEMYELSLSSGALNKLVKKGLEDGAIILASKKEINNQMTKNGKLISKNSIKLVSAGKNKKAK